MKRIERQFADSAQIHLSRARLITGRSRFRKGLSSNFAKSFHPRRFPLLSYGPYRKNRNRVTGVGEVRIKKFSGDFTSRKTVRAVPYLLPGFSPHEFQKAIR